MRLEIALRKGRSWSPAGNHLLPCTRSPTSNNMFLEESSLKMEIISARYVQVAARCNAPHKCRRSFAERSNQSRGSLHSQNLIALARVGTVALQLLLQPAVQTIKSMS